jgi:hypothetical protein
MAAYTSDPVVDPDELGYSVDVAFASATEEIVINTTAKTIALKVLGNLTTDGATIKAVYSKLKDAWRVNTTLIKFPFPMGPITDEQFEMKNGWNWDKTETSGSASQTTPELIRTGGWAVLNTANAIIEEWAGIVTLGTLGSTDQVYYQQVGATTASVNFKLTGPVNQAVQILRDDDGDGNFAEGNDFSRKAYFKIFVREWQKLYAQSEIADIGVATLLSQAYRFPLTNSTDLKISKTEVQIDANSDGTPDVGVYANVNITYLRDSLGDFYTVLGNYDSGSFAYSIGDVVKDTGNNRWYKCIVAYTSNATQPSANSTNWAAYEGERLIGTTYYPFTVIIDGDTTVPGTGSGGAATVQEIYEAVQYKLRQNIDIDASSGSVTGKTANSLLKFTGDRLDTSLGVYIDSYNASDTNNIQMATWTTSPSFAATTVNFPFVASLRVNFGENLQNDQYSKYWVFFTNANGNEYGTTNAIIVQDNDDVDMAGVVNPNWPTKRSFVSHTFDYDNNIQGGRTGNTPADVTVVGLGLSTGQFVSTTTTIGKNTGNSASLVAALERNYSQGTTFP